MTIKRRASIAWFCLVHSSYCFRSIYNYCLTRSIKADCRSPLRGWRTQFLSTEPIDRFCDKKYFKFINYNELSKTKRNVPSAKYLFTRMQSSKSLFHWFRWKMPRKITICSSYILYSPRNFTPKLVNIIS